MPGTGVCDGLVMYQEQLLPSVRPCREAGPDFGKQGGDPARGVLLDLSTCVNRYGPAPAAVEVLQNMRPADILMHPYDGRERLKAVYSWATGADPDDLVAGRAGSEFIWAMGRCVPHEDVAIPLPGYTDYLKAFPGRGFTIHGEQVPSLEQIDAALSAARLVIVSNPHNPTGELLDPRGLVEIAADHPDSTLVVDESYVEFTSHPTRWSAIGSDADNLVVIQSASKFWGIAAVRAGVAWCRDHARLRRLVGVQETWGVSGVDVTVAEAALRSTSWAAEVRARLHADSQWLADRLTAVPGLRVLRNANVHFQYAFCPRAWAVAAALERHGVGVRVLSGAHGVRPDALRVVAPRSDERSLVASALAGPGVIAAASAPA